MENDRAKEAIEVLREQLMDNLDKASSERDEAGVDRAQQGRTALSVLENSLKANR